MYERIIKNGITSLIGLAILGFCGYIVIKAMNNGETVQDAATGVSGWITTGLVFLRSKNSILGIETAPENSESDADSK